MLEEKYVLKDKYIQVERDFNITTISLVDTKAELQRTEKMLLDMKESRMKALEEKQVLQTKITDLEQLQKKRDSEMSRLVLNVEDRDSNMVSVQAKIAEQKAALEASVLRVESLVEQLNTCRANAGEKEESLRKRIKDMSEDAVKVQVDRGTELQEVLSVIDLIRMEEHLPASSSSSSIQGVPSMTSYSSSASHSSSSHTLLPKVRGKDIEREVRRLVNELCAASRIEEGNHIVKVVRKESVSGEVIATVAIQKKVSQEVSEAILRKISVDELQGVINGNLSSHRH